MSDAVVPFDTPPPNDDSVAAGGRESFVRPTSRAHFPALDGVRGIAILMVLAVHFIGDVRPHGRLESAIGQVACYGALGVDLFFVLSGFLITGILCDSRESPAPFQQYLRNFYARRVLRIFPLYYAVLFLGLVVLPRFVAVPALDTAVHAQGWLWAYSANVYLAKMGDWEALPIFNHFWSLAIEEHFYFVWPLVVFLCDGPRLKRVALLTVFGALAVRVAMVALHANDLAILVLTPGRLDGLAVGGLLAVVAREDDGPSRLARWAPRLLLAGACFIAATYVFTRLVPAWRFGFHQLRSTAFALCFGSMVTASLHGPLALQRFFGNRVLRFFGKYSYGLYVFHFLFGYFLVTRRTADVIAPFVGSHLLAMLLQALAATGVAVLLALASYHGFEKHFLKLKGRFPPAPPARTTFPPAAAVPGVPDSARAA
jgi:peptidoglycan/LPS O-acetylase OafA/YrhL